MNRQEIDQQMYHRFFHDPTVGTKPRQSISKDRTEVFRRFFVIDGGASSNVARIATADEEIPVEVTPKKVSEPSTERPTAKSVEPTEEKAGSWYRRIHVGLSKTRRSFSTNIVNLFVGKKKIDDDLLEEIETQLLIADLGVEATNRIISSLTEKLSRSQLKEVHELNAALRTEMRSIIEFADQNPLEQLQAGTANKPFVILVVGVNGVGKTTTIGKLANRYKAQGLSVMLAAGDTFRAAAVEQLQEWGERNDIPVVAQHTGADSASVIFDAVSAAKARGVDVLIADTAGRLHTKSNLMDELRKVRRVIEKVESTAPHEVLLVLDAGTGQNALVQAQQFNDAVQVNGVVLTKLDGTAKGGILFAICEKLGLPLRYIGVGEQASDLRPFVSEDFIEALFDTASE